MLGTAGDIDFRVADQPRQRAADEGAGVPGRRDVGVVEHGVAMTAQAAIVAGLGLCQHGDETAALGACEFKDIAWESTRDAEFTEALRKALPPEVLKAWFDVFTAARQRN